jgi:hypothetical protein
MRAMLLTVVLMVSGCAQLQQLTYSPEEKAYMLGPPQRLTISDECDQSPAICIYIDGHSGLVGSSSNK